MPPGNPNFDQILSTTLRNYRGTLEDNFFNAMPLLFWLKSKERKDVIDGGESIVVPLMYSNNDTAQSYDGLEPLNVAAQNGITAAKYEWKQVAASITISRKQQRQNSAEAKIVGLLEGKIKQAELSMMDVVSVMLFADSTGNAGKDIHGLQALIANIPSTGVVGGIDRATNVWWRNTAVIGTKASVAFDNLVLKMRNVYNTTSKGKDHPDLIMSDQASFEGYEGQLVQNERFIDKETGDAGFTNLKFKGAVCMFDDAAPATSTLGNMYFINSKYMSWTVDKETDFISSDFVRPNNQDGKTAQILLMANLVISNAVRNGVIYSISLT